VFRGPRNAPGGDTCDVGSAELLADTTLQPIGKIGTAIGPATVTRAGRVAVQLGVGDLVYQGDIIETGEHGAIGITFTDGTAFNLSAGARMVLNEFVCDSTGTSNSALFNILQGTFAFIAGKVAKTGSLRIDTPVGRIRAAAQDGGIGILTLAGLSFTAANEIQAASRHDALLDDGTIAYKDLPHGTLYITTKEPIPRTIIHDDPGETLVLRRTGSGVTVNRVTHSSDQMATLQEFYHQTDRIGQQQQQQNNSGSSGNPISNELPFNPQLTPVPINNVVPGIDHPTGPAPNDTPILFVPRPPPPPPPTPTIAITTIAFTQPGDGTALVNANQANAGIPISGTTSQIENGRTVTITIIDGSNRVVYNGTATVTDGTWSADLDPAEAKLLADGNYTVVASVSDSAGHAASPATALLMVDETPPVPTIVALAVDSGRSAIDHITNVGTLALSSIETGALVEYSVDGGAHWSRSFTAVQGANTVLVRQTDVAGNVSSTTTFSFTLDTVSPSSPSLALVTDSGSSSGDHITNNGTLALSGVETDSTVEYSIDGGANWSASFTAVQGANTVLVRQTDVAGNVSSATSFSFTFDTVAAAPGVALTTDSGSSSGDHITNNGALALAGIETGALVEYSIDGGAHWSSSFTAVQGANTVQVRQTDVAGNVSSATSFSFTLDTVNPAAPGVALTSDSGSSSGDHISNVGTLALSGVETGAKVEYSIDGGAHWSSSFAAVEGANTVQVRQTDVAGNVSNATSLSFTLDTTAPTAPGVALTTDSGSSSGDHISNVGTLALSGIETGAKVEYSIDGGAHWSSSFTAAQGANTVQVRQTDVAGNVSNATSFSFTLDTVAPTAPGVALTADSGSSSGDHITNIGTLALSGVETGALVEYSIDGGAHWSGSFTAVQGANTVQVRQTDVAGNVSSATSFTFTLDTTAPNAPTIASVTDDVGSVIGTLTSGATTDDPDLTVRVSLTGTNAVAGDAIQLYDGTGTSSPLGSAYTLTATDIANGYVDVATGALTTGTTYDITVRITDTAGNVSAASSGFDVTVDTSTVTILANQTLHLSGGGLTANFIEIANGGTLQGFGTITATVIDNNGTIQASSNHTLSIISGDITGTGQIEITNNTTLSLTGSVGSGQTVAFDIGGGATGRLILADPAHFYGQISGLTANDQIDLTNIDPLTAQVSSVTYNSSTGITTLVITDGPDVDTIRLVGNYTTSTWHFSSDGTGGTLVVDPPASTTTSDAGVVPVRDATTVTMIETASGQTGVSSPTVDDGKAVALNTTGSDPDGGATTSVTIDGNNAVAGTTGNVSVSRSVMIDAGTALECTSLSHTIAGTLSNDGTIEVTSPPLLARTALSRDRGTFTVFEAQIAIASIILVIEYATEKLKLASDGETLLSDRSASADATLVAVSETSTVDATRTADTQAVSVSVDDGAAMIDAAATPDGGMSNLTIGGLPFDLALTDSDGEKPTITDDAMPVAYADVTEFGLHGSSKDQINVAATNSAEGRIAAKPLMAVSSHTTSLETESDHNWNSAARLSSSASSNTASMDANASDAAPIHSAVAGHWSTIVTAGAGNAHDDFANSHGPSSEHGNDGNDQPSSGNANPGDNGLNHQPGDLPSQAASHAAGEIPLATAVGDTKGGDAPLHGPAAEHPSTIDTTGEGNGHGDPASSHGPPPEHGNDQPHSANTNPDDHGLGHQPGDLPSQAASHAAWEIPLATAVEDTKGSHAGDIHGRPAESPSTIDTAGAGNGHGDPASSHGPPAEHGNDQPHSANASPDDHGLGHQPGDLPSQAASHAAGEIPLATAVEDTKGGDAPHTHGPAAEHPSTIDTAGAGNGHGDPASFHGAAAEHGNDQPNSGNANPDNNGLGHQPHDLPSQTASNAAVEIPPATAVADAKGGDAPHAHGPAAEHLSTLDTAGGGNGHDDSASSHGAAAEHGNDQPNTGNANADNNGLGQQQLPSPAASNAAVETPLTTAVADVKGGDAPHIHGPAAENPSTIDTTGVGKGHDDSASFQAAAAEHANDQPNSGNASPDNTGLGQQQLPSQAASNAAAETRPATAVADAKGGDAPQTHGLAAENPSTIDTAGAAAAHDDSPSFRAAPSADNDQFHFAYANPGTPQTSELPGQAASHAAADIPLTTTDNDIASLLNNLSAPTAPAATDKLAPQAADHPSLLNGMGSKDLAVTKDGLVGDKGNDQFVFDPGLGHNASMQLDPATDKPHSAQQLFQALDDLLTRAAQAPLDTVTTPAEPHDIALTNVPRDEPSTHFIIHA